MKFASRLGLFAILSAGSFLAAGCATAPAMPHYPLSENFESGQLNPDIWTTHTSGAATVAVTQDKVAHGKYALKVVFPAHAARNSMAFISAKLPASLHDHVFGRAYVYCSSIPPAHGVLLNTGTAGFPKSNFLELGTYQNTQFQPSFQEQNPPAGQRSGEKVAFEGAIPIGRWFCLEWEFTDLPTDKIIVWVDGQKTVDQSFVYNDVGSGLVNGFAEVNFGFRTFTQPNALPDDIDIYFDDIAISDQPIGQLTPVAASASK